MAAKLRSWSYIVDVAEWVSGAKAWVYLIKLA
jgi:hypothetical protein